MQKVKVNGVTYLVTHEHEVFRQELKCLEEEVLRWAKYEQKLIPDGLTVIETILHNLATFNFKSLGNSSGWKQLDKLFGPTTNQQLIDRLDGLMLILTILIDPNVLNVCKGRFYCRLLQQKTLSKYQFKQLDMNYPDLWIIPFIQRIYQTTSFL